MLIYEAQPAILTQHPPQFDNVWIGRLANPGALPWGPQPVPPARMLLSSISLADLESNRGTVQFPRLHSFACQYLAFGQPRQSQCIAVISPLEVRTLTPRTRDCTPCSTTTWPALCDSPCRHNYPIALGSDPLSVSVSSETTRRTASPFVCACSGGWFAFGVTFLLFFLAVIGGGYCWKLQQKQRQMQPPAEQK